MALFPTGTAADVGDAVPSDYWRKVGELLNSGAGSFYNVKNPDFGALGNNSNDDTAEIQAAVDATAAGDTVLFPPGTYLVSSPIVYKPFRRYVGLGPSWGDTTIIKVANGSSANFQSASGHSGVFVPESWNTNATTPAGPVDFLNLTIHGNKANNATGQHHGLILYGEYWCQLERLRLIENKQAGLLRTMVGKNGTANMATGISDNRFKDIFCIANGGHGAQKVNTGSANHTDEVWDGTNLFFDNGLSGFWDDQSAGFRGSNFHFSNNGQHAFYSLDAAFAFRLDGLYVESIGLTAAAGLPYFGFRAKCANGEPVLLSNFNIRTLDPAGTSLFYCLALEGVDTDVHAHLSNIHLMGAGTSRGHGVNYNASSGKLTIHEANLGAVGFVAGQAKEYIGAGTITFDPPRSGPAERLNNLKAWAYDPNAGPSNGAALQGSGRVLAVKVPLDGPTLVTNIILELFTAGVTLTAGQNLACLYDSAGAKIATTTTADQSTAWTTTGTKVMAISGGPTWVDPGPAGWVWVGILTVGTTPPAWRRGNNNAQGVSNVGTTTTTRRFGLDASTGNTALPANLTPSTMTAYEGVWAALS